METLTLPEEITKPGTVIEWWTNDSPRPNTQKFEVIKPVCANSGQMDRAGECSCAPSLKDWREAQVKDATEFFGFDEDMDADEKQVWIAVAEQLSDYFIS